ncbi:MAG: right-handed parallel beta-helix repeat-containing protein [Candidatus Delongbacteria bacterium]|nr:right-handed parallel beta-helix repeat-containing protein [Candidatus Delongbacteria bacterium]
MRIQLPIRYLITTLLLAGLQTLSTASTGNTPDPVDTPNGTASLIMHRLSSKVSGETIELTPSVELHIMADLPPEVPSTIIMAGGLLFFENGGPPREGYEFGTSFLTEDILASIQLESNLGAIHYIGAELNSIADIPAVTAGLAISFVDSWLRNHTLTLAVDGGVFFAGNTIFEMEAHAVQASLGSQLEFIDCIFVNSTDEALNLSNCDCSISNCLFLTNETAIYAADSGILEVSGTVFQGNKTAVQVYPGEFVVDIHHSAFWGNWDYDIINRSTEIVHAEENFWSQGCCIMWGVVAEDNPLPESPRDPEQLADEQVIIVPIPPLADGDEPLMWNYAGKQAANGLPVNPTYKVYRSNDPYNVFLPENLIALTHSNAWRDLDPPADCGFYCVTFSIHK